MKKVFILTQFGKPHPWTQEYFDNVAHLEKDGWYWLIFTPNKYDKIPPNVKIINMDIEGMNKLMEDTIGVNPKNHLKDGVPSKAVSDFYIASGAIFKDYLKDANYWGITNWDIVYGDLSKFIPDEEIRKYDIWTDDVETINGIFCLFKNENYINTLFTDIPGWQEMFSRHHLYGLDEYHMTEIVKKESKAKRVRFGFPYPFPLHSHDRLRQHVPDVKLGYKDGGLWEFFEDTNPPKWIHARPYFGREIPYLHFIRTKTWPNFAS